MIEAQRVNLCHVTLTDSSRRALMYIAVGCPRCPPIIIGEIGIVVARCVVVLVLVVVLVVARRRVDLVARRRRVDLVALVVLEVV